ncbi:MAG TPA: hypothetical protein VMV81_05510 [Phycisphaerae bacterium]|nr:hypothetical protein [Phycisphaerae bacterium]
MNQKAKISVAVGILVLAGGVFFWFNRGGAEESLAKSDESKTAWMCAGCQGTFDLTAKEVVTMEKAAGGMPLVCPKCKEKKVYRAIKCAKCGTLYFSSDVPDSPGVCPKCNPEAKPKTIEERIEEVTGQPADEGKSESADPAAPKKPRKIIRGA